MTIYIRDRATFATVSKCETVDWELVEDSAPADYSTFSVAPDAVSILDTGKWLLAAGTLLTIDRITPGDERTEIRCLPAYKAFDAYVIYGAAGTSTEAYIAAQLQTQYVEQTDPVYAMPYLRISYSAGSGFTAPDVDKDNIFVLSEYIETQTVRVQCSVSSDTLRVSVTPRPRSRHNIVFGDGHAVLSTRAFSLGAVAKITTIQGGVQTQWYLAADGSISNTVPDHRADGSWIVMGVGDNDDAAEKAAAKFADNRSAHKVEFWSDRAMRVGDRVSIRLGSDVCAGEISYVGRRSGRAMTYYKSGDLAITLTDQIRRI